MAKRKITPKKAPKPPPNSDQSSYQEIWCPIDDYELELLAIIIRKAYVFPTGVNFVTQPDETLQVGTIRSNLPARVRPHRHLQRTRTIYRTQEVLMVRRGLILVDLYSSKDRLFKQLYLQEGDVIVLLNGGHGLTLEGQCDILEVKTGPYMDRTSDKVDI